MSLKNLNLMIYHADLQPARGMISPGVFFAKKQKKTSTESGEPPADGQTSLTAVSRMSMIRSILYLFCTEYYHCTYNMLIQSCTKIQELLPVLPTAKSVILTMYKKTYKERKKKNGKKKDR